MFFICLCSHLSLSLNTDKYGFMSNSFNYILLTTLLCLFSCVADRKPGNAFAPDLLGEAAEEIRYSQFVDSLEYIPLETTDECLIGKITDIALTDDRIFVLDELQQTVWVFTSDGRYINRIGKRGEGPGEYLRITQLEYDKTKNQLIVLSSSKLFFYDATNGEYIKTIELDRKADDFKLCPDGGFILSNMGEAVSSAGVYRTDAEGNTLESLVTRSPEHLVCTTTRWELCSYGNTLCFMAPNFKNDVYHYDGQHLTCQYAFQMKPELKRTYRESVSLQHLDDFMRTLYLEGEKWIYAVYWSAKEDIRVLLFSKEEGKYRVGRKMVNDLDKIKAGKWTSSTEGNRFVTCQNADDPEKNPVVGILYLK